MNVFASLFFSNDRSHEQKPENHEYYTPDKKIFVRKQIRHRLRVGETACYRKYNAASPLR